MIMSGTNLSLDQFCSARGCHGAEYGTKVSSAELRHRNVRVRYFVHYFYSVQNSFIITICQRLSGEEFTYEYRLKNRIL